MNSITYAFDLVCISVNNSFERARAHDACVRLGVGVSMHVSTQLGARAEQVATMFALVRLDVGVYAT
jgi:hypothetical protein